MSIDDRTSANTRGSATDGERSGPRTAPVLRLVFMRELRTRARSGAFIVSSALTLLLIVGAIVVPSLFGASTTTYRVGVIGSDGEPIVATASALASARSSDDVTVETVTFSDVAQAEQALGDEAIDAAIVDGRELVLANAGGLSGSAVQGLLQEAAAARRVENLVGAEQAGQVVAALTGEPLEVRALSGQGSTENQGRAWIAYGGLVLTYMVILTYGVWTLTGVTEEKANRVIELLLAAAKPSQLLAGKILGISVLGLAQFLVTVVAALIAIRVTGTFDLPALPINMIGVLVLWVVVGFSLYMVLFGAAGALASKTEDAQTASTPISLLAVGSFFLSFVVLNSPDGLAAVIGTYVPFTAPFVVPIRSALGVLPLWQHLVAIGVCVVTTALLLRMAGRVYAGGALQFGGRLKWREALRRAAQ